jgi:hypothetical protein
MTDPRTAARYPGHVHARLADKMVTEIIAGVLDQRVFGPDRAAMLTVQLPATAAEQQLTELETQTAAADDPRSWPPSRVPPASSPPPCPRSARLSTPPWTCRSCTGRTRTR